MRCTGKNSPAGDVRGDTGLSPSVSSFPVDPLRGHKPICVACTGTGRAEHPLLKERKKRARGRGRPASRSRGHPRFPPSQPEGLGRLPRLPSTREETAFSRAEPAASAPSACHPRAPERPARQDNTSTDSFFFFFLYIRTFISQRENIVSDSQIIVGKISICSFLYKHRFSYYLSYTI